MVARYVEHVKLAELAVEGITAENVATSGRRVTVRLKFMKYFRMDRWNSWKRTTSLSFMNFLIVLPVVVPDEGIAEESQTQGLSFAV